MPAALTPARITELLSGKRNRGGHLVYVNRFAESGDMFWVVNEALDYKGKSFDQLKNGVSQGLNNSIKKLDSSAPRIKVTLDTDENSDDYGKLFIINMDVYEASLNGDQ
jgi:hypothetical protein